MNKIKEVVEDLLNKPTLNYTVATDLKNIFSKISSSMVGGLV
jgi:hypothetical protein